MPVVPADWITLANSLVGQNEIANRSAASRAYYGAFHACRPLADQLPNPVTFEGMHDRAIRAMKEYPVTTANRNTAMAIHKIGILLGQCRSLRTKADYKCSDPFFNSEAQEAIDFALKIIAGLQTIKYP
jgi:uncharacterized protein (UPF0332 family)